MKEPDMWVENVKLPWKCIINILLGKKVTLEFYNSKFVCGKWKGDK